MTAMQHTLKSLSAGFAIAVGAFAAQPCVADQPLLYVTEETPADALLREPHVQELLRDLQEQNARSAEKAVEPLVVFLRERKQHSGEFAAEIIGWGGALNIAWNTTLDLWDTHWNEVEDADHLETYCADVFEHHFFTEEQLQEKVQETASQFNVALSINLKDFEEALASYLHTLEDTPEVHISDEQRATFEKEVAQMLGLVQDQAQENAVIANSVGTYMTVALINCLSKPLALIITITPQGKVAKAVVWILVAGVELAIETVAVTAVELSIEPVIEDRMKQYLTQIEQVLLDGYAKEPGLRDVFEEASKAQCAALARLLEQEGY